MRSNNERIDRIERSQARELDVLSCLLSTPQTSQRQLSQQLNIALGLSNSLVRNLVKKGCLRASKAGWKRWVYTLTPYGLSYRLRLMVAYIRRFLDDYSNVRKILRDQLNTLVLHEESRVAIVGTGELAELVYLGLREHAVEEVEIYDVDVDVDCKFLGFDVREVERLAPERFDKVLIAALNISDKLVEDIKTRRIGDEQLVYFFDLDGISSGGSS